MDTQDHTQTCLQELGAIANPKRRLAQLVWLLERASYDQAMRLMIASFADPFPMIRQWSARMVAERLDDTYAHHLRQLFEDQAQRPDWVPAPSPRTLGAAALALKGAPGPDTEALMATYTQHPEADLRYQACDTLFAIDASHDTLRPLAHRILAQERDHDVAVLAAQIAATHRWHELAPALAARLEATGGDDRLQFALALVELAEPAWLSDHPDTVAELFRLLESHLRRDKTTAAAATALATLARATGQASRAKEALRRMLTRRSLQPILKVELAARLTELGDPQGLEHLSRTLSSRRRDAKGHAIDTAGRLRITPLYGQVARIALCPDDYHHDSAILALGNYATPKAHQALEQIIADARMDDDARSLARRALAHQGDEPLSFF